MWYKVRKELSFNYSIEGRKYNYKVPSAFYIKLNKDRSLRIKKAKYMSMSVRSLINPNTVIMTVSVVAGQNIPLNIAAYEKLMNYERTEHIVKANVDE